LENFHQKTQIFQFFPLRIKKISLVGSKSTWVIDGSASYLLWVKSLLGSGQGPSLTQTDDRHTLYSNTCVVVTFPIKKRINTELFVDRMAAFYVVDGWIKDENVVGRGQPMVMVDPQIEYTTC